MGKKIVLGAIGLVVIVVAVAVGLVVTQLDRMVGDAVATYGRAAAGTAVSVGSVDIALTEGRGGLARLTVGNPAGFTTDYALRVDDIDVALDLGSLSSDTPVVTELLMDGAHLNAEQRGDATNLTDIQSYLSRSSGESPSGSAAQDEARIIIDRFRLTNARVTVTAEFLSEPEDLELDDVIVEGIGRSSGGATYTEAAEALLAPILAAARAAAQNRLRSAAGEAAREEIEEEIEEEAGDKLRSLLDRD
jgi:hypothetical protein